MIKSLFHRKPESPIRLYHKDDEEEKKDPTSTPTTTTTTTTTTVHTSRPLTVHANGSHTASGGGSSEVETKDDTKEGTGSDSISSLTIDTNTTSTRTTSATSYDDMDSPPIGHSKSSSQHASSQGGSSSGSGGGEKRIDVMGVVEFNPQIHVLDNTSSGISSRKVLELLGMKGDLSIVPESTHQLTMLLDTLMEACHGLSRAIDKALE